jgi:hypothetical protein
MRGWQRRVVNEANRMISESVSQVIVFTFFCNRDGKIIAGLRLQRRVLSAEIRVSSSSILQ